MHEERPNLKMQAVVSVMLCFSVDVLYGAGAVQHALPTKQVQDSSGDRIQHLQKPAELVAVAGTAAQQPEIICPTSADVRQSIDACQRLATEARKIVRNSKQGFSFAATKPEDQTACWMNNRDVWQNKNDLLIAGCDLLLSAHGDEVNPEILRALKNLNNAQLWLGWAVDAASQGKLDTAHTLIRYADRSIKRADRLISLRYPAYSHASVVQLPSRLKRRLAASMGLNH